MKAKKLKNNSFALSNNLRQSLVFSTPELNSKSPVVDGDATVMIEMTTKDIEVVVGGFDGENQPIKEQKHLYQVADVIPLIFCLKKEFEQTKLLKYMQDETISHTRKLDFAPYFAYFVNSFSDLNKYILPYNDTELENDELGLKKKLNKHMEEDESHNILFNDDTQLFQVKFNNFSFSDYLTFLWNDNIKNSRLVGFGIAKLTQIASEPRIRYCLIRTIEELGNTFFSISHKCRLDGHESKYFGSIHLGYEPGGLHLEGDNEEKFLSQNLTLEEYNLAKSITQECYILFFNFLEEVYDQIIK
ncbi:hypothetical protein G7B40_034390 [Aetokthonos hydrillicola Thurmond2011]|jgi:hypothetical protein|uniref:Uncharacterized protein n=1 Tax=Aetokthonos hydrillicola Thurmond2011 TaxID=2712845 RepID=A0AAP5IHH2_9CYAN|nr:hypothetical protein [Aetokthonos hydrillicola]MBO3458025.1 hypothetical protein [Aetokthonos hydrillicola CCALA 1050]MBW4587140.1 hypothetical protein [Aetokthonos hydrillicola CCALA 1050]MDR9899610.1 hypothetical protein [Aetokthonos hydrillicola Thurmond2011]